MSVGREAGMARQKTTNLAKGYSNRCRRLPIALHLICIGRRPTDGAVAVAVAIWDEVRGEAVTLDQGGCY